VSRHAESMNIVMTTLVVKSGDLFEPEAAAIAGMSLRRFRAVFPEMFGKNFRVMRHHIRMEGVRKALEETNRSIRSISEQLGYSARGKLERSFKGVFGVTPAHYRKNQKFSRMATQGMLLARVDVRFY
jgi:AraC-like DNA-binding protein